MIGYLMPGLAHELPRTSQSLAGCRCRMRGQHLINCADRRISEQNAQCAPLDQMLVSRVGTVEQNEAEHLGVKHVR